MTSVTRVALITSYLFLVGLLQPIWGQTPSMSYEDKKRQTNDIAVTIVVSGLSCTCARFAEDIRNVVNDLRPDGVRVLPVLGVGGLQNLNDVLFLKGIDMGVVDHDNLKLLKRKDPQLYANIEQRVQYITKLYNAEFHVLARADINSYGDLQGKKVNFNLKDSQTEVSADIVFNALKIDVERSYYDNDVAISKLRNGELSAMIVLTGAPQAALAKISKDDGLHFLPLIPENSSDPELRALFSEFDYLPAELTHETYPNLIPEGTSIPTIANRALLVAYAWPENSPRYKKLAKFVHEFFDKIDEFHNGSRHPKWSEVNLATEIRGWTRFKPAADWLAEHRNVSLSNSRNGSAAAMRSEFDKFMENYTALTGQKALSGNERDMLFANFQQYLRESRRDPTDKPSR